MGIGHDTRLPRMTIYKVLRYLDKAGLCHPFVIVVADRDATVGVVSSMLLEHQIYRKKFVE
jgi:hypothetical protein